MKIYNTSKAQLITLWIFGFFAVFAALVELDTYDASGFALVFLIVIPAVLLFYTFGWRAHHKTLSPVKPVTKKTKDKNKKSYIELVFLVGFIFSWMNLLDPTYGLFINGTSEANPTVFIWYLAYIIGSIGFIYKAIRTDLSNNLEKTDVKWKKRHDHLLRSGGILVITLIILISSATSTYRTYTSADVTSIMQDALYGTNKSGETKYVSLITEIFNSYNDNFTKNFTKTIEIDSSEVLEFSSFETLNTLNYNIELLEASIAELDGFREILNETKEKTRERIRNNPNLSENEKIEVLAGFNNSVNSVDREYLINKRYQSLQNTYEEVLELYNFIYLNYYDYFIDFDENYVENIYFYTDENIDIYNMYMVEIEKDTFRFLEADQAFIDYTNQQFKNNGIDITAEDIQSFYSY